MFHIMHPPQAHKILSLSSLFSDRIILSSGSTILSLWIRISAGFIIRIAHFDIPNSICISSGIRVRGMSEIKKRRGERLSHWNIPLLIWALPEEPHFQLLKLSSFVSCCFGSSSPYSELYQTSSYIEISVRVVPNQMLFYNQSKPFRVRSSSFYSFWW